MAEQSLSAAERRAGEHVELVDAADQQVGAIPGTLAVSAADGLSRRAASGAGTVHAHSVQVALAAGGAVRVGVAHRTEEERAVDEGKVVVHGEQVTAEDAWYLARCGWVGVSG